MILQKNVNEKDSLLGHLAEKMSQISQEYSGLKANYAKLQDNQNKDPAEEVKSGPEVTQVIQKQTDKQVTAEVELNKSPVIDKETQCEEFKIRDNNSDEKNRLEECKKVISDLQSENNTLKVEKEKLQLLTDELMEQNEALTSKCDTLTKGLTYTKEEYEKALVEIQSLKSGIENLKQEHENLWASKEECESTILALNADLIGRKDEKLQLTKEVEQLKKYKDDLLEQLTVSEENMGCFQQEIQTLKAECKDLCDKCDDEQNNIAFLSEENVKLKEDNATYKTQVANFEDKLSEICAISDENHSLRVQNDDLNNKINDQKDVIAALKAEVSVVTQGNSNLEDQLQLLTKNVSSYENESIELREENDKLLQELVELKSQVVKLGNENIELRDENVRLSDEIETENQDFGNVTEMNKPLAAVNTETKDRASQTFQKASIEPVKELCFESVVTRQAMALPENVQNCADDSAKTISTIFQEPENNTHEIISEDVLHAQIICDIDTETSTPEQTLHCASANAVSNTPPVNDTAYDSLLQTDKSSVEFYNDSNVKLKQTIEHLQLEVNSVREALQQKTQECDMCHEEIHTLKQQYGHLPVTPSLAVPDTELDNVCNDNANEFQEVSEVPSASGAVDQEVNLHASSSPSCHINNVVALDSCSPGNVVTGDSCVFNFGDVDEGDAFQKKDVPVLEAGVKDSQNSDHHFQDLQAIPGPDLMRKQIDQVDGLDEPSGKVETYVEQGDKGDGDSVVSSDIRSMHEISVRLEQENTELLKCLENTKDAENTLRNELKSEKQKNKKLYKDCENTSKTVSTLQTDLQDARHNIESVKAELKDLSCEHEKVTWERNEMVNRVSELENEILQIKAAKCDVEFQKEQFLEELGRVKDRLEYLEASDNDVIEIKEMLDTLQEERELIGKENEKLQCSLSSQLEENERLVETLDTLHKENSVLLENLKIINEKDEELQNNLKEIQGIKLEMENEIEDLLKSKKSENVRFVGEIEGLVEENSTLKTNVQIKQSEAESLRHEVDKLKSAFDNLDKVNEDVNVLSTTNKELERKLQDVTKDNENLVSELMEFQQKFTETVEEKEILFDKCEEYQTIVNDLDLEKTELLDLVEKSNAQQTIIMQEQKVLTEKYEMQLEALDQENSTLKTKVIQLEDENSSIQETVSDFQITMRENSELKSKVKSLEEKIRDFKNEIETSQAENKTSTTKLESLVKDMTTRNDDLKIQCAQHEQKIHELLLKEEYLKEQLKIHEESVEEEKNSSEQMLTEQLELEKKYKIKLQRDVEQLHCQIAELEKENKQLLDKVQKTECDVQAKVKHADELEKKLQEKVQDVGNSESENKQLKQNRHELREELRSVSAQKSQLEKQLNETVTSLHFMSANRDHVRHQVEILAAEVEQLSDLKDSLMLQYNEKDIINQQLKYDRDELSETVASLEADLESVVKENINLKENMELLEREVETLAKCMEEKVQSDEHLKIENEHLKSELEQLKKQNETLRRAVQTSQDTLKIDEDVLAENEKLNFENRNLQEENDQLKHRNDDLVSNMLFLKGRVAHLTDLMDQYKNAENLKMKELDEREAHLQKKQEQLQIMREDLSVKLQELQTKYEYVQSEMEATKKQHEREIAESRIQFKEMKDAVKQLRNLLDYMENEYGNAIKENESMTEKLKQKEKEISEVKEQKNRLEAMLDAKQQKDLKNMKMVSKHHGESVSLNVVPNNDVASASDRGNIPNTGDNNEDLSSQDENTLESNAVEQLAEAITAMSESLSDLNETYEMFEENENDDSDSLIPSFERAFELFNLRSNEQAVNRSVQTNLTIGEFEDSGFLLDDNGENYENEKDTCVESIEIQTDCSYMDKDFVESKSIESVLQSRSIQNIYPENKCDQTVQVNLNDQYETYSECKNIVLDMDEEGIIHPDSEDQAVTFEDQRFPIKASCSVQCELLADSHSSKLDSDNSDIEEEDEQMCRLVNSLSIVSTDSGILSAPVVLDDRNLYKFDAGEHEKEMEDTNAGFTKEHAESNELENKEDKIQLVTVEEAVQTDLNVEQEIEFCVHEITEQIKHDYAEKIAKTEVEIEDKILRNLEDREDSVKQKEKNYERKIRNVEFEIEEKYANLFREREVEVVIEAEKAKKAHADEVERDAKRKIERVKQEKDQQFVETLQKVKADFDRQRKTLRPRSAVESRSMSYDPADNKNVKEVGPHGDSSGTLSDSQMHVLQVENQVS